VSRTRWERAGRMLTGANQQSMFDNFSEVMGKIPYESEVKPLQQETGNGNGDGAERRGGRRQDMQRACLFITNAICRSHIYVNFVKHNRSFD